MNRGRVVAANIAIMGIMASGAVAAEQSLELSPIVVTVTRVAQASDDVPASIDSIDSARIRDGQLQVNLSESLLTVPGVSAQNRQNYAQDLQLSVRGFGARSSFGVRGVRLYADGIPGTMPDGQGQFSQFDLSTAGHIEVLRGPFSALYGNSSGGVIAVFTEDSPPGYSLGGGADYGSFNTQRYAVKAGGDSSGVNYVLGASHFQTDGYRFHSDAERNNFNGRARFTLSESTSLNVVANAIVTPFVQDPLGLTRAQLAADPQQAGVNAVAYNTRKNLSQEQFGITLDSKLSATDAVAATLYTGHRATTQYQAIAQATQQAAPLYPGGVIDLGRAFWGVDAHLADQRSIAGTPLQLVAGVSFDDLQEARRGYLNYNGAQLGVEGGIRRDEANHVYDFDQYVQAQWDPAVDWRVLAGVRHSVVDVTSHNHLTGIVEPDSGVTYSAVNPVAGVTFRAASSLHLYASYGRGFETPTLNDLAYRSTNGSLPGLNLALKPARSNSFEAGVKAGNEWLHTNAALFYTKTTDELAVLANSSGRTVNQNIGETTRRGAEFAVDVHWGRGLSSRLAYTYIRAVVAQPYYSCVGAPCKPPATLTGVLPANYVLVAAGSHLPAVPENSLYADLTWTFPAVGFSAAVEAQTRARIYVDDRNSDAAAGYWVANLRAGFEQESAHWRFSEFARLENVADRHYVGSVIVNESNSRFFESAPGRTAYLMFNAAFKGY